MHRSLDPMVRQRGEIRRYGREEPETVSQLLTAGLNRWRERRTPHHERWKSSSFSPLMPMARRFLARLVDHQIAA